MSVVPAAIRPLQTSPELEIVPKRDYAAPTHRKSWVEVNYSNLNFNLSQIRKRIGQNRLMLLMVKANAYGHGLIEVSRFAMQNGVQGFGVATEDEALTLRETKGFETTPIVLLAPSDPNNAETLQRARISVSVGNTPLLKAHLAAARRIQKPANLHINIDTGLGRDGFSRRNFSALEELDSHPDSVEGLFTHFACSDGIDRDDIRFTRDQIRRFRETQQLFEKAGIHPIQHLANSGAVHQHPDALGHMVRPGIMALGAASFHYAKNVAVEVKPVLSMKSRIVSMRDFLPGETISYNRTWMVPTKRKIGIIPVGYGDGYPLALSNQGCVLVRGKRAPIRGRICMDQLMVDLKNVPNATVGDEVTLIGRDGKEEIRLEEIANLANTIVYDVICAITQRVPRVYR